MSSGKENAKDKIFQATLEILASEEDNDDITTRQIAQKAGVNLALISYYYQSKENLLSLVGMSMMDKMVGEIVIKGDEDISPDIKLRNFLLATAKFAFKHHKIFSAVVRVDIKQGCKNTSEIMMPLLEEIFKNKSKERLNIIALQLFLPFQNILANPKVYNQQLDTDFFDDEKRALKINEMLDSILSIR